MKIKRLLAAGLLLAALLFGLDTAPSVQAEEKVKPVAIGEKVPNSKSLRDLRGNRRPLHDFKNHKAIVLVFVGTECPVSNLYLPELVELEKKYRTKNVDFFAIYPNQSEDLDQLAAHARDRDVPFLVLKDTEQQLADIVGVSRIPAVAVLDENHKLCYRGRVDDRYGVASRKPKATRADLAEAIDEVLAGKKVTTPETEADGCLLDRGAKPAKTGITYTKHVASILQKHCQVCHRPEQSAPFSLLTYEDAVKHGRMVKEVSEQRRMPPWHADPRYGHFANDRRLSKDEIQTIQAWVEGGMVKGDDKDMPKPVEFPKGWTLGAKPDVVLEMPEEFAVPATGTVPYKNYIIETKFTEDRWVQMAECKPGVPGVVHHIVVYIMKEGTRGPVSADGNISILVGWAPGDLGLVCPPDTALRVPKGAKLRLEMHYTPNGIATKDRSSVGIWFAPKAPKYELMINEFANMGIAVPPNDPHYRAEATFRLPADARIISFGPHMHWRGKDYLYEVTFPDGKREVLLSVPRYDFNWQNVYRLKEPIKLPKGSKIHSVAHFDNSRHNPLNPAPEKTVYFGLQSWEEMMVGFVMYVWERPETAAEIAKNPPSPADLFFDRLDVNGDEVITWDEIPERMKPFIALTGIPFPEKMSRVEFVKFFEAMRGGFGKRPEPKNNAPTPPAKP